MAMPWFKFYGQDFLSDPKIKRLNPIHQLMWVYLLCLSSNSKDGLIEFVNENDLISMYGISPLDDSSLQDLTIGFFTQLVKMKMIEVSEDKVLIINYTKRQESHLSDAERSQRYRDKHFEPKIVQSDERHTDNVTKVTLDKIRLDEDKNKNILEQKAPATKIPSKGCTNPKGHRDCIESINSIQSSFKKKFPNYGKQIKAYHQILKAEFNFTQVATCLNAMDKDKFWSANGWDLMDVANQLGKGGGRFVSL